MGGEGVDSLPWQVVKRNDLADSFQESYYSKIKNHPSQQSLSPLHKHFSFKAYLKRIAWKDNFETAHSNAQKKVCAWQLGFLWLPWLWVCLLVCGFPSRVLWGHVIVLLQFKLSVQKLDLYADWKQMSYLLIGVLFSPWLIITKQFIWRNMAGKDGTVSLFVISACIY